MNENENITEKVGVQTDSSLNMDNSRFILKITYRILALNTETNNIETQYRVQKLGYGKDKRKQCMKEYDDLKRIKLLEFITPYGKISVPIETIEFVDLVKEKDFQNQQQKEEIFESE